MKERLKKVRKTLKLTMEEFGSRLGVQKTAISRLESGVNNITEQMIILICNTYNVSEEWLRTGQGEMFIETKETYLDDLGKQYALDDMDLMLIETFLELETAQRQAIKDYIIKLANAVNSMADEKAKIDAEVESYRRELEAESKGAEKLSASQGGEENTKKEAK